MAVVALKSTAVTNSDAHTSNTSYIANGHNRNSVGMIAVANGDSIASTYRLVRIPSGARMSAVRLACTAITSAAGDIGLYQTADNGGAVVDADFFVAAQSIASALTATDVIGGNVLTPANREKRVWEAIGLTADPQRDYDIAVTLTAAATAAGSMALTVDYNL